MNTNRENSSHQDNPQDPSQHTRRTWLKQTVSTGVCVMVTGFLLTSLTGCGGGEEAHASNKPHNAGPLTFGVNNRTGKTMKDVYIFRLNAPLSFGSVAPGAIDRLKPKPQKLPRKVEVQWVDSKTNETEFVIVHLHKSVGSRYQGPVTITIDRNNKWSCRRGG